MVDHASPVLLLYIAPFFVIAYHRPFSSVHAEASVTVGLPPDFALRNHSCTFFSSSLVAAMSTRSSVLTASTPTFLLIIVQKKSEHDPAEQGRLEQAVEAALSEAMDERGWTRGAARAKVAKL